MNSFMRFLKKVLPRRARKDPFKRDNLGHPVANHYGVDSKPNEPFDSKSPNIRRYESEVPKENRQYQEQSPERSESDQ